MGDYIRKFDISTYSGSRIYAKYDVVKISNGSNGEYYFVSAKDSNVGQLDSGAFTSNSFWKRFDDFDNDFADIWVPSYTSSVETEPRVVNATLDDGTTQLSREGINTVPLKFTLTFENIKDKEAFSLLCFFDFLGNSRAFVWTVPTPYNKRLKFSLTAVKHSFTKKDVHTVNIAIEQSFVIFGIGAGQQKYGSF